MCTLDQTAFQNAPQITSKPAPVRHMKLLTGSRLCIELIEYIPCIYTSLIQFSNLRMIAKAASSKIRRVLPVPNIAAVYH